MSFIGVLAQTAALAVLEPAADSSPQATAPQVEPVPGPSTVVWVAPPQCPSADDVRARIEALLGKPLDHERTDPVVAAGIVRRQDHYVLELEIQDRSGTSERSFEAETCEALVEAATVVVAVAVDPALRLGPEPQPQEEPPTEPAEPALEPEPAPTPVKNDASHERLVRGHLRASGAMTYGPLPAISPGVSVALGISRRWFRAEVVGSYWFARTAALEAPTDARGTIDLGTMTVRGCGVPEFRKLMFPLCVGPEVGVMTGRGRGIEEAGIGRGLWGAVELGAGVVWAPISHLGLGLEAKFDVPWSRPGFAIEGLGLVHRADPVAIGLAAGIEVRFP